LVQKVHLKFWLGRTDHAKGDFIGAEIHYDAVLQWEPNHPSAHFWRADCRLDRGKYKEALEDLERVLSLDPGSYFARINRGRCFERIGQYDAAVRELTEALKLRPQEAHPYSSRAHNYFMLDRCKEALADCDQAVRFDPENAYAYSLRGEVRKEMGDHKGALADLTRDVQMRPNKGIPLLRRGRLLIKMGDSVQGRRDLHRAIELFTKEVDEEGVRLAREALTASPTAPPEEQVNRRSNTPEWNGTWVLQKLDDGKKSSRETGNITLLISQTGQQIKITRKLHQHGTETVQELTYYTDGRGEVNPATDGWRMLKSNTKLRENKLIIRFSMPSSTVDRRAIVNKIDEWKLSSDGRTLTQTSSFSSSSAESDASNNPFGSSGAPNILASLRREEKGASNDPFGSPGAPNILASPLRWEEKKVFNRIT
jgi:tetratricopeptide (TPR) repeat protein